MSSTNLSSELSSCIHSWLFAIRSPPTSTLETSRSLPINSQSSERPLKRTRSTIEHLPATSKRRVIIRLKPTKRSTPDMVGNRSHTANQGITSPSPSAKQSSNIAEIAESLSASYPSNLKLPRTSSNVRQTLASHGMYISMGKLKTDYKTFYDELMEMLTGERASPRIGEGAADHLIRWLSQNNAEPESGMLRKIVESLIPIQRTQKFEPFKEQGNDIYTAGVDPFSSSTAQQEPSQLETSHQRAPHLEIEAIDRPEYGRVCGFSEDDLVYSTSSRLNKSLLPSWKKSQRHIFETYNAKEYGLSEPRPDYCYGIVKNRFPDVNAAHISEYASVLIGVASNLLHAFLIVEGKSSKGSLADAENQAIRGGATIVYARRILNNKAGLPESVGPDRRSFSFSLTVDFGIARLWVHWCEVQKRQPGLDIDPADTTWILPDYYETYHMDCLVSCDFFKTEDVRSFQAAIKKVLDWGCLQRKSEVMKVLGMVARRERELVQCQDGGKGSESSRLAKRPRKEE